ncbi:unnamed protein product [Bursaphelenchus okinawaensis]|uniref:Uncharacterized protein n=1 Tax=Bursaphelenchus okinawaensis TaxID=465554 RepID=A0A811KWM7_9BILA|nr:unnamed protein product [Bursaphelenchus okinawaensis]CAG9113370.1 unnamed protein product [Bursaphelenchus okinawaensis]
MCVPHCSALLRSTKRRQSPGPSLPNGAGSGNSAVLMKPNKSSKRCFNLTLPMSSHPYLTHHYMNSSFDSGMYSDLSMESTFNSTFNNNTTFNSTLNSNCTSNSTTSSNPNSTASSIPAFDSLRSGDASGHQIMGERFLEPASSSSCALQSRRKSALATPASSTAVAFPSNSDASLATQLPQCSMDSGYWESSYESSFDNFRDGSCFESSSDLKTPLSMFKKSNHSNTASPLRSFIISSSPKSKINLFKSPKTTIDVHIDGSFTSGYSKPRSLISFQNHEPEPSTSSANSSILSSAETPSKYVSDSGFSGFTTYSPTKAVYNDMLSPNRYIYSNQDVSIFGERSPLKHLSLNTCYSQRSVTKRPASAISDGPEDKKVKTDENDSDSKVGQMSVTMASRIRTPRFSQKTRELIIGQTREQIEVLNMAKNFFRRFDSAVPAQIPLFETEEEFETFAWEKYESDYGRLITKRKVVRLDD